MKNHDFTSFGYPLLAMRSSAGGFVARKRITKRVKFHELHEKAMDFQNFMKFHTKSAQSFDVRESLRENFIFFILRSDGLRSVFA